MRPVTATPTSDRPLHAPQRPASDPTSLVMVLGDSVTRYLAPTGLSKLAGQRVDVRSTPGGVPSTLRPTDLDGVSKVVLHAGTNCILQFFNALILNNYKHTLLYVISQCVKTLVYFTDVVTICLQQGAPTSSIFCLFLPLAMVGPMLAYSLCNVGLWLAQRWMMVGRQCCGECWPNEQNTVGPTAA